MKHTHTHPVRLRAAIETFPLKEPFHITGYTAEKTEVVTVTLRTGDHTGRGEASGVYYRRGEDVQSVCKQIESVRGAIEAGITRESLQQLLPHGGARNAIDCALWDLDAKLTGRPVWDLAGLGRPQPLRTTFTVGANEPGKMAADALAYGQARAIKLKLTGERIDLSRVRAVRAARPDVWLGVDANQGFTHTSLETLLPVLLECRVRLIEQPFKVGQESQLDGWKCPIPVAADESVQGVADLAAVTGRFDVVNIKLDKCGGLTEGLEMAHEARRRGLRVMVGNMVGTSLAMAPSYLVGQLCNMVDLDGPIFLREDRSPSVRYDDGNIACPEELWGTP